MVIPKGIKPIIESDDDYDIVHADYIERMCSYPVIIPPNIPTEGKVYFIIPINLGNDVWPNPIMNAVHVGIDYAAGHLDYSHHPCRESECHLCNTGHRYRAMYGFLPIIYNYGTKHPTMALMALGKNDLQSAIQSWNSGHIKSGAPLVGHWNYTQYVLTKKTHGKFSLRRSTKSRGFDLTNELSVLETLSLDRFLRDIEEETAAIHLLIHSMWEWTHRK